MNWNNIIVASSRHHGSSVSSACVRSKSGGAHVSGVITLVQETDDDVQQGFLYYLPFYDPTAPLETLGQRQAAFIG